MRCSVCIALHSLRQPSFFMFFVPHRVLFQSPGRRGKSAFGLAASGRGQDPQQSSHFSQEVECSSSRLQICVLNV